MDVGARAFYLLAIGRVLWFHPAAGAISLAIFLFSGYEAFHGLGQICLPQMVPVFFCKGPNGRDEIFLFGHVDQTRYGFLKV